MDLTLRGPVHVLTFEDDDLRVNDDWLAAVNAALDTVEAHDGPSALVLTGSGKSFHQGLDLDHFLTLGDRALEFARDFQALFGRMIRLDLITVAAINGHAIAGGAMIAMACDIQVMRSDRGWLQTPEVDLNLPFTVVMNDLLVAKWPQPARRQMMLLSRRVGGSEAASMGLVDEAVEGDGAALARAIEIATEHAHRRGPTVQTIRRLLYEDLFESTATDGDRPDPYTR